MLLAGDVLPSSSNIKHKHIERCQSGVNHIYDIKKGTYLKAQLSFRAFQYEWMRVVGPADNFYLKLWF